MEFITIARLWVLISFAALFAGVVNLLVFCKKNREYFLIKNNQNTDEVWQTRKKVVLSLYQRKELFLFFILVVHGVGLCFLHYCYEGGEKWLIATICFAFSWPLVVWLKKKS
jgi:hypothetical protein